jgi:predicted glutamine amidotransferase
MCRWLAYSGNAVYLDQLLVGPKASLVAQSMAAREAKTTVNGDGCGVAWYGERSEPGVYRNVLPAWSDTNLSSLCRVIRSRLFMGHVRSATSGEISAANCHPFTHGRHMFMHNGQIGGYDDLRRKIEDQISDCHFGARRGTGDSEALFLAALGHGLDKDPIAPMAHVLGATRRILRDAGITKPIRFAAALSDGQRLWAYRWASDDHPPTVYWREFDGGTIIASEPFEPISGWTRVLPASVLCVGPNGEVVVEPFEVT